MSASSKVRLLSGILFALQIYGCGGGGDEPSAAPPPCDAAHNTCYVSPDGNDGNSGDAEHPFATVIKAAQTVRDDYTIQVFPGLYRGQINSASVGRAPQRLRFLALGGLGDVVIDVTNSPGDAGFSLSNSDGTVIDGFTVIGAADAGIVFKRSEGAQVRNCRIFRNPGDGIRMQDSAGALVFNNLVYRNSGDGIRVAGTTSGSPNARVINNTIFDNGSRGIEIGNSSASSAFAQVLNNIVQDNQGNMMAADSIKVNPNSLNGYHGDYNLVSPGVYSPSEAAIKGDHDRNEEAMFVGEGSDNFHLSVTSPAIDTGSTLPADLDDALRDRTTTGVERDTRRLDLGFHYPCGDNNCE